MSYPVSGSGKYRDMFGDHPCPSCRRILVKRYEPSDARLVAVYACWACGKEWESCPRCGGVVVDRPKPVDLFTSRVLEFFRVCSSCHQEPPKKAG